MWNEKCYVNARLYKKFGLDTFKAVEGCVHGQ